MQVLAIWFQVTNNKNQQTEITYLLHSYCALKGKIIQQEKAEWQRMLLLEIERNALKNAGKVRICILTESRKGTKPDSEEQSDNKEYTHYNKCMLQYFNYFCSKIIHLSYFLNVRKAVQRYYYFIKVQKE